MSKDIVKDAIGRFEADKQGWKEIYNSAKDDLRFMSDDASAQWDSKAYQERIQTGRPALQVDQLGQFVHQVANDIRMNTPSIKVIPSDADASEGIAEIYQGLIREVEYYSNADDIYDTAALYAVKCSIGFIRIDHGFAIDDVNPESFGTEAFLQRLFLKRVVNPLNVYLDSESIECDGRDANHGTILEPMSVAEFKRRWPKMEPVSFEEPDYKGKRGDDDNITVAEHFCIKKEKHTITSPDGLMSRDVDVAKVMRYWMSGKELLEEETRFPGRYIPIVPVYGEEAWIDGKRKLFSLIRRSKDAQRMYNFWKSLETELLMKAPNAPVMAAKGQTEEFAEDWKNPTKTMVLRYSQTDANDNPAPPPQRLEPPTIPTGVVNASRQSVDDIKSTMGIYNAALGQISNEQSGIAIRQRQQESDTATFHFSDNLVRSITQVGRILVSAIPEIYDTPRIVRMIDAQDQTKMVGVNGAQADTDQPPFDLKMGRYDVKVITGASYTTKRQEAAEFLSNAVQQRPEMMNIIGDLLFENLDFAGADAMAERMKKVIDPKLLEEAEDPIVTTLQAQVEELNQVIAAMKAELDSKAGDQQIKAKELEIKQQEAFADIKAKAVELQLKAREIAIKEQEMQADIAAMQQKALMGNAYT